jgi:hypothetical protein
MNNFFRRKYYRQIKFNRYFYNIRKNYKIYNLKNLKKIDIKINFLFYYNVKIFKLKFIYYINSIIRLLKNSFFLDKKIKNYYNLLNKKLKFIKYNYIIKKFLKFFKKRLSLKLWKEFKIIIFFFIIIILGFYKLNNNIFNLFFKSFILLFIHSNVLSYLNKKSKDKFYNLYNFNRYIKNTKKITLNKKFLSEGKYNNFLYQLDKQPFLNIIKYDYSIYLKNNPYIINSIAY